MHLTVSKGSGAPLNLRACAQTAGSGDEAQYLVVNSETNEPSLFTINMVEALKMIGEVEGPLILEAWHHGESQQFTGAALGALLAMASTCH